MILSSRIDVDEYFMKQSEIISEDKSFLESIKELDVLPLKDSSIKFSDDCWVFLQNNDSINYDCLELDFSQVNYFYRDIVKGMIYEMKYLMEIADSTIRSKFFNLNKFIKFLESKYVVSYTMIDSLIVKEYLNSIDASERSLSALRFTVQQFLSFIEENYDIDYKHIMVLLKKTDEIRKNEKAEREMGKTGIIPEDILNSLISCAMKEIESNECGYKERLQAIFIVILSQTGIRIGDARKLNANMVEEIGIFDDEEKACYLKYFSYKTKKEAKTFLTPLAKRAYDEILIMTKPYREKFSIDYLFFNQDTGKLYTVGTLRRCILEFILRNYRNTNCLDRDIDDVKGFRILELTNYAGSNNVPNFYLNQKKKKKLEGYKTISIPTPHMFRVTLCTQLINQGVDVDWVREHMNHLYEEMTVYYVRKERQSRLEIDAAKALLKEVLQDEVRLIGKDSESMTRRIEEFIINNKFIIKKDLDVIIEELVSKIPIRKKNNGYCIKSAFGRKCSIDSGMNDIYCAFGVCNNHFVTYKSIDISYIQFKSFIKVIEYNLSSGFKAQVSIELNKLHRLIEDTLFPQLNEMDYEISRKSYDKFILDNHNIREYIDNREAIMKEVLKWKDMTMDTIPNN